MPHHLWQSTPFRYRGSLKRAVESTLARQDDRIARTTSSFVRRSKGLEGFPCGGFVDEKLDSAEETCNFSFRGEARSELDLGLAARHPPSNGSFFTALIAFRKCVS